MSKTNQQSPGFSVFAFTWAVAAMFHQLSFTDWRWYDVKGIVFSVAALLVLHKPNWQRFAFLVFIDWISVALAFPDHPNHIVFSWIVNGTLLASLAMVARKGEGIKDANLASRWYTAFAPWVRIEVCILYLFTAFHKLNVSYFDLDWSCSVSMYRDINDRIPFLPETRWVQYATVYGTLMFEAGIPLLLIFRRTRATAIIIGMLFHGLLALHSHPGVFSFSATMMALYTTFLSLSTAEAVMPRKSIIKLWRLGVYALAAALLIWTIRKLLPSGLHLEEVLNQNWKAGLVAYFAYMVTGLFVFIRSQRTQNETQTAQGNWRAYPLLSIFVGVLVLNGLGPYFGLKTQTSFSMFSNLHTENGESNHLIMPSGLQFTKWQYDLVDIVDSNDGELLSYRDKGLQVVFLELRRLRTGADPNFRVTFIRHGNRETFDMKRPETYGAISPLGFLSRRYFFFRPVERDPTKVRCKH